MPAGPITDTSRARFSRSVAWKRSRRRRSSSSRPTNGASSVSPRLRPPTWATARTARHAGTGLALPLSSCSPAGSKAMAREADRWVASPTSTAPGRRHRLEAAGGVHQVAGDHALIDRAERDGRLAGQDAGARLDTGTQRFDRLDQVQRRPHGSFRVVLVRGGRSPDGHDGIADELLHRAAIPFDDVAGHLEIAGEQLAGVLRITALGERREPDEVGEEDADQAPLGHGRESGWWSGAGGRGCRWGTRQRRSALGAEPAPPAGSPCRSRGTPPPAARRTRCRTWRPPDSPSRNWSRSSSGEPIPMRYHREPVRQAPPGPQSVVGGCRVRFRGRTSARACRDPGSPPSGRCHLPRQRRVKPLHERPGADLLQALASRSGHGLHLRPSRVQQRRHIDGDERRLPGDAQILQPIQHLPEPRKRPVRVALHRRDPRPDRPPLELASRWRAGPRRPGRAEPRWPLRGRPARGRCGRCWAGPIWPRRCRPRSPRATAGWRRARSARRRTRSGHRRSSLSSCVPRCCVHLGLGSGSKGRPSVAAHPPPRYARRSVTMGVLSTTIHVHLAPGPGARPARPGRGPAPTRGPPSRHTRPLAESSTIAALVADPLGQGEPLLGRGDGPRRVLVPAVHGGVVEGPQERPGHARPRGPGARRSAMTPETLAHPADRRRGRNPRVTRASARIDAQVVALRRLQDAVDELEGPPALVHGRSTPGRAGPRAPRDPGDPARSANRLDRLVGQVVGLQCGAARRGLTWRPAAAMARAAAARSPRSRWMLGGPAERLVGPVVAAGVAGRLAEPLQELRLLGRVGRHLERLLQEAHRLLRAPRARRPARPRRAGRAGPGRPARPPRGPAGRAGGRPGSGQPARRPARPCPATRRSVPPRGASSCGRCGRGSRRRLRG